MKNEHKKNWTRICLLISVVCILVSMVGACLVQSAGGSVLVHDFKLEVGNGDEINAQIYIPKDASADHKLPLVVVQHGSQHNLEMQDMNMVELACRGFVVISSDAFGHGASTMRSQLEPTVNGFDNMRYIIDYACQNLDCIDTENIGIAGHSMGAAIVSTTLQYYVQQEALGLGENKIKAALEIGYDPSYVPYEIEGVSEPVYADSNWGVIAGKYDEYFFRQEDAGNDPARILESQAALDFVRQADPAAQGPVENGKYYEGEINGKQCVRVYYQNPEIHPQNTFSSKTAACVVEYFYKTLGTPDGHAYIEPTNQVWLWKQLLNGLGLVGILLFLFPFASWIMDTVPFFGTLKAKEPLPSAPALDSPRKKLVYWITYIICLALPAMLAMPVMHNWIGKESFSPQTANAWFGEGTVSEIAGWSLVASIAILAVFLLSYFLFSKKYGATTDSWGYKISLKNFGKSLLLAFITFLTAYGILFFADFFFNTDFRFWLIAMRVFNVNKVFYWLAYVPAFMMFYLVNSVLVNGGNRVANMPDWLVTVVSCVANFAGIAALISVQYIVYANNGTFVFNAMRTHNLFPFLILVPIGTIITRKFFKKTGNIYLGSFTVAMLYTMMQVTQVAMTMTFLPK